MNVNFNSNGGRIAAPVAAVAAMLAGSLSAVDTLVWTGRYSDNLNDTDANWTNRATGAEACFTMGAAKNENIVFCVPEGETKTVTLNKKGVYNPSTMRFDVDGTLNMDNTTGDAYFGWQQGAWAKYGKGTVHLDGKYRIFVAPGGGTDSLTVHEGTFDIHSGYETFSTAWNSAKNITVKDGATFAVHGRNMQGAKNLHLDTGWKVIVEKGGRFHFDSYQDAAHTAGHSMLPNLELNDSKAFDFGGCIGFIEGVKAMGMFTLGKTVVLNGTGAPYGWSPEDSGDAKRARVHLRAAPGYTEFRVADVVAGDAVDFHLGLQVADQCTNYSASVWLPGGLIKTGAGTMTLTNHLSSFTGDIIVREGTLMFGPETAEGMNVAFLGLRDYRNGTSWFGSQAAARTFSISNGATLYIPHRNVWGSFAKITNSTCGASTFFIDGGGKLKFRDGQVNVIPNVTVKAGARLFEAIGTYGLGVGMIAGTFRVTGDAAFEWPWHNKDATVTSTTISRTALSMAGYPETVFDVGDVTDDVGVDCTIHIPFIVNNTFLRTDTNPVYDLDDWFYGFRKAGVGTMRLTAPSFERSGVAFAPLNGYITVAEGTLQVDGGMLDKTSNIVVNASAMLAGTGTVKRVTFDAGGGFRASASQAAALTVLDACSFGAGGTVDLVNSDSVPVRQINAKLMSIGGEVSGREHLSGWTVTVDGVAQPCMGILLKGGTLHAKYFKGFTLGFK
ncbi:MAG: autotransporter-associated beta strand repeat-containing protein [Kiritimatiellae bacterium]|nr:autotransporter-associated beta strand repeat-containing protein [Kiritimatiellia bacterium]